MTFELLDGFVLGAGNFLLTGMTGLGKADIRTSQFLFSGRDGGAVSDQFYGMRPISLTGVVSSESCTQHELDRSTFDEATPIDETIPVLVTTFTGSQFIIYCSVIDLDMEYRVGGKSSEYKLELLAADPLFYDATDGGLQSAAVTKVTQGGYATPYILPVSWDSGSNPTIVTNSGNALVYPVITLTGSALNPSVTNQTTGETFELDLTASGGDVIVIDMGARTVTLNGANVMGNKTDDSIWWGLALGPNSIVLDSDSGGDTVAATIEWRNGQTGI